ncbi:MAG: hypothetical protein WAN93_10785, partial [Solirubrobacteraceae bacterium]
MSTRWEYLFVSWQSRTNLATRDPSDAQTSESDYWLTRPNTTAEKVPADVKLSQLLNDLGAEGWDLVSHTIPK